jgi:4-amino-4-deoxy-L-arabinose transferase-like glycosyltransferase
MRNPAPSHAASLLILAVVTAACLLPFIGKAFHIDDPLFVWCARHIRSDPFNFYGFNVNWDGEDKPMAAVTQNPPLAAYYMALVGFLLGWSEISLHLGFIIPALAAVIGTHHLARHLCSRPLLAALGVVTAPVFLLSGSSLMCDTMMLAFWVWAVSFWIEGLKNESQGKLFVAALLVVACSMTKYFGACLIPLLAAYSLREGRRIHSWLAYLLFAASALAFYQWLTQRLYGHGLLLNAMLYATQLRVGGELPSKILSGLAFVGGCMVVVVPAAPLLWKRNTLVLGLVAAALVGILLVGMKSVGSFLVVEAENIKWPFLIQMSVYVAAGLSVAWLAIQELQEGKTPGAALLALWITGTFVFACAVNWTISGRNILPMLPAVSILLVRRLEMQKLRHGWGSTLKTLAPFGISLTIAALATLADCKLADSAKESARLLTQRLGATASAIRFEGHWGFQYYMEELGAKALDRQNLRLVPNEAIVVPSGNSYLFPLPEDRVALWSTYETTPSKWLTTMSGLAGAGYYSDGWGPLPFVFCSVPAERYLVYRVH